MRIRFRKSVWLPATLLLYAAVMSAYFGPSLIAEGQAAKFWISVGVELIFVAGLFFALRHKEKLQGERMEREKDLKQQD